MKFVCIKTNNESIKNYLLENIKKITLDDVYLTFNRFKIFNNIIIFYKGKDLESFYNSISNILADVIINIVQSDIIKNLFENEYFYFDLIEKEEILDHFNSALNSDTDIFIENRNILLNIFYDYLTHNHRLYLKGFVTFRLKKYIDNLQKFLDISINEYLLEKEYLEFVSLLKSYVENENCLTNSVYLMYTRKNPILLDENKKMMKTDINTANAKYLSDISFSSCDKILNTLLNVLPKRIYIYLENSEIDDFINTLQLIFNERIVFEKNSH